MRDEHEIVSKLRSAGLRPTKQRLEVARLLFQQGHRHVNAERLHAEASADGVTLSLATVYNALNDFTKAGLTRVLAVEGSRNWFDTNTADHHHYYVEGRGEIVDVDGDRLMVRQVPEAPDGFEIVNVDIVIRLRASPLDKKESQ